MTTLADLRTEVARALRDTSNATWSVAELDDMIGQGIDAIGAFYPREISQSVGTIATNTYTYDGSAFNRIWRLSAYTSAGAFRYDIPPNIGGADSGYELYGGIVYLPAGWSFLAGDTLRAWGYTGYVQLSAATSTTDLDTSGINALLTYCQVKAFGRLMFDRAQFQQWQSQSGNTDVTELVLAQTAAGYRADWRDEKSRLRRLRK